MNAMRRLGVVLAVVLAGLVGTVTPAAAADGLVRYENVGNPGWCMNANLAEAFLQRCTGTEFFEWQNIGGGSLIRLYYGLSREDCLTAFNGGRALIRPCGGTFETYQSWDVWGSNGWVVYQKAGTSLCLIPKDTQVVAQYYPLTLVPCPPSNNVPNIFAWRYH
jgi:hypothetical protein